MASFPLSLKAGTTRWGRFGRSLQTAPDYPALDLSFVDQEKLDFDHWRI